MIDYGLILSTHYIGKQWTMLDSGYENIEWLDETSKPTKKELDDLWEQTQITSARLVIQQARQRAYQQTTDPLMAKYLRDEIPKQEWLDAVQAIKDANPYPQEIAQ